MVIAIFRWFRSLNFCLFYITVVSPLIIVNLLFIITLLLFFISCILIIINFILIFFLMISSITITFTIHGGAIYCCLITIFRIFLTIITFINYFLCCFLEGADVCSFWVINLHFR